MLTAGSQQVSVYDTVALSQPASIKDIIVDSDTAYLLTDDAVRIFAGNVLY